MLCVKDVMYVI